ncbi:MAG: acyl-CoA thioesterase [Planctomycetota bacterium]|jgi:acyl-CoA thioester hydrolase
MDGEITVRVRYGETDCMGRVYHANYLQYFECGRVELMRAMDFDYAKVEREDRCFLPVFDAAVKYRAPAFFDDELKVKTSIVDYSVVRITFAYTAARVADGVVCAEGRTVLAAVDENGEPRRLPEDLRGFLESLDLPPERERRRRRE